jgi:DNA repair exonuclease SbcCD ATPase subunit
MQSEVLQGAVEDAPSESQIQAKEPGPGGQAPALAELAEVDVQPVQAEVPKTAQPAALVQAQKKSRSWIWIAATWVFVLILVGVVGGLGYRVYSLTTNLGATQQQLAALQAQYDQLRDENENVSAELEETKSELEENQNELTTTQADLNKEQSRNKDLQTRMSQASKLMDVVVAMFVTGENEHGIETKVKATQDAHLIELFENTQTSGNIKDGLEFLAYLFETIAGRLKESSMLLPTAHS